MGSRRGEADRAVDLDRCAERVPCARDERRRVDRQRDGIGTCSPDVTVSDWATLIAAMSCLDTSSSQTRTIEPGGNATR